MVDVTRHLKKKKSSALEEPFLVLCKDHFGAWLLCLVHPNVLFNNNSHKSKGNYVAAPIQTETVSRSINNKLFLQNNVVLLHNGYDILYFGYELGKNVQ